MTTTDSGPKNTIQDLIDELMKLEDKSGRVYIEGCDCDGVWSGEIEGGVGVLLMRDHEAT